MKNLTTNRLFQVGAAALVVAGLGYVFYSSDDTDSSTEVSAETTTETSEENNTTETTNSENTSSTELTEENTETTSK